MKRIIEVAMAIAIISLSLALVSPVKAYVFYGEFSGEASTSYESLLMNTGGVDKAQGSAWSFEKGECDHMA